MAIEQFLQITMGATAALSTLLLSMGHQLGVLPFLVSFSAMVSVYVTDFRGWIRLHPTFANLAALVAAGYSVSEFYIQGADTETLLVAVAYLLAYLQIVLLFQVKSTRVYWQLAMASFLQVVVSCALNEGILFGILLVVYVFGALSSLSLLFIHRQSQEMAAASEPNLAHGSQGTHLASHLFTTPVAGDASGVLVGRRIVGQVSAMVAGAMVLSFLFFFSIPRVGRSYYTESTTIGPTSVGFSEDVKLGQLGTAVQNPEVVMQVKFYDSVTGKPYPIYGEPLFRGSVLTGYQNGRWTRNSAGGNSSLRSLDPRNPRLGIVRQEIILEPLREPVVFSIYPACALEEEINEVQFDFNQEKLVRVDKHRRDRLTFELGTYGFWKQRQHSITPAPTRAEPEWRQIPSGLDGLTTLAASIIEESEIDRKDVQAVARLLEGHFLSSGKYGYTLSAQRRDPGVDPIEDFVVNNPQGHCEYFASALTLMLRSLGIPARMVVGFKGEELNNLDDFFQIRQLHAHTWVEAYIPQHQMPPWPPGHPFSNRGLSSAGWLRLDPTPGSSTAESDIDASGWWYRIRQWQDYAKRVWTTYVVRLTPERQNALIYRPLQRFLRAAWNNLRDAKWWRATLAKLNPRQWLRGNWFSWRGGLVAMAVCIVLVGMIRLAQKLWRRWRNWSVRHAARGPHRVTEIEFYRRYERLLARHGYRKLAYQTPAEFAGDIRHQLADRIAGQREALIPEQVTAAYYQVRFGGEHLTTGEQSQIDQSLSALSETLDQIARGASASKGN